MTTATTVTLERREALERFFPTYRRKLERHVAWRTRGVSDDIIHEACAFAWMRLVVRSDVRLDSGGFWWLATVATQEARRYGSPQREIPMGPMSCDRMDDGELPDPLGFATDPLDRALDNELHVERIECFARLKPRERRELLLKAGGYSYREIGAITGSSYTAVNRRLAEGRAQLRRA